MKKLFVLAVLLCSAVGAWAAATVTGNVTDIGGNAGVSRLTFYPISAPYFDGTNFVKYSVKAVQTDASGNFSTTLARGDYRVVMDGENRVNIGVPAGAGPFAISALQISALTYPWQTPPALNDVLNVDTSGATDGQALTWNAASGKWVPATVVGSGGGGNATNAVTSINGSTNAVQSFAVGHTGTDFNIVSSAGTHTFNAPRGLPVVNAKDYGVVGDGSDETARVQAAYDAIDKTQGGRLFIPKAKFNLVLKHSNVHLEGGGYSKDYSGLMTNCWTPADVTLPVVKVGDGTNVVRSWSIENATFFGTVGATNGQVGLLLSGGAYEGFVRGIAVWNFDICIKGMASSLVPSSLINFYDVLVQQTTNTGSRGFNLVMPASQSSFTTAYAIHSGHINGVSTGTNTKAAEFDGCTVFLGGGLYWDMAASGTHSILLSKHNAGALEPYIISGGTTLDAGGANVVLEIDPTCASVHPFVHLRGHVETTGLVQTQSGSTFTLPPNFEDSANWYNPVIQNTLKFEKSGTFAYASAHMTTTTNDDLEVYGGRHVSLKPSGGGVVNIPAANLLMTQPFGIRFADTNGVDNATLSISAGNNLQIKAPAQNGKVQFILGTNSSASFLWQSNNTTIATLDSTGTFTPLALAGNGSGVTNLGAGNLASGTIPTARYGAISSATWAGVLSDETGTGAAVFGTGPNIDSPHILNGLDLAGTFRVVFVPWAVGAGINVGSVSSDPSTLQNGDLWYRSDINALRARINTASVTLGTGTVTSVDLAVPSWLTVSGNPVTGSGTITIAPTASQTANRFLATPDGVAGTVGLRAIAAGDVPSLDASKITTGTLGAARLGSGTANAGTFLFGDQVFRSVNDLTADATPDSANDYVMTWDASAAAPKKVLLGNLPTAGGGEVNTASSLGTGWGLPYDKSGVVIRFNSITNDASLSSSSNANTITFSRAALTGDVTASAGGNATTIAAGAVTLAKMANITTDTLIGRDTAGTGAPEAIAVSGGIEFTGAGGIQRSALTGDVTASAGSGATTIASGAVTFAKMQTIGTDTLIGRDTAGTGAPESLTVSGGLEFTGSAGIQRSALTGDVTASAGSGTTALAASIGGTHTWTGSQVYTNASHIFGWKDLGAGSAIDYSASQRFYKQLTANVTWTTSNEADGAQFRLLTEQDATGGRTQTFPATWIWTQATNAPSTTAPVISTNAGVFIEFEIERRNGTNYARIIGDRDSVPLTDLANGTATSAEIAAQITDESGTGAFVMSSGATTTNLVVKSGFDVQGDVKWSGDITPAQITSDQDNYNPTGLSTASTLRLSTDASRNITGLAGGADGRWIVIHNVGAFNIVLKDSVTSTAANQFALTADVTLAPDAVALLQYDSTSSRWRMIGGAGGGGSGTVTSVATSGGITGGTITGSGTISLEYTATLGGNPAMNSGEAKFSTNGIIFEGSTADVNETLLTVTDPTADRTITLPNASGTVAVSASGAVSLDSAGNITATRTGVYRTLWMGAGDFDATTTNAATASIYTVAGADNETLKTWTFNDGQTNYVNLARMMPDTWDLSTVKVKFFWTATSGSGNIVWQVAAGAASDGDALGAILGTAQTVTDTLGSVNNQHVTSATSALTVGGTPALGDLIVWRVWRDAGNASDTFTGNAQLLGIAVQYKESATENSIW